MDPFDIISNPCAHGFLVGCLNKKSDEYCNQFGRDTCKYMADISNGCQKNCGFCGKF